MSEEPRINVTDDGPYMVSGSVPLSTKTPVVSEHGEPMAWKKGETEETRSRYALCRCGASANKPFCDGAHAAAEWDGAENAADEPYAERRTSLGGQGLEIFDDRGTCMHAGFCGNEVTNVWKLAAKTDDSRLRAQAMAMIERCPSGALTYEVDGEAVEPDLPPAVAIVPDGPLWVHGNVTVEGADGREYESRNRVTLCRCGQSAQKPYCDGSHKEAGFTG